MLPYFFSADEYFKQTFHKKIFRLSLDGGMTCPNRDGTVGTEGCAFCSTSGSGDFAEKCTTSIADQIERAKTQVSKKLPKNDFFLRAAWGGSKFTSIASLPITSIEVHGRTMSSYLPKRPKHLGRPSTTMFTILPLQVSTSTSPTQPSSVPLLMQTTCFCRISVILQHIILSPFVF